MHVDLLTLYFLIIGTLFASSGMILWESRVHPKRSKELKILAAGYATLAIGCAGATQRHALPGVTGSAISNLVIVTGYLLLLHGVAVLNGRRHLVFSIGVLVMLALTWAMIGTPRQEIMWAYLSAIPIALVSGATSLELLRGDGIKSLQSRHIAVIVAGIHASFYAFRALILPWLVSSHGQAVQSLASKVTMYEGVLYSVILPMALLRVVRDEAHRQLLQESQTDYLTGLGNRRWFFEQGTRVIRECGALRPVSVLAFDLDHFKSINDRYGHDVGDAVLKSFGDIARGALGPEAILARIGGEEFAALLPGCDSAGAKRAGEAVVSRFAQTISHRVDGVGVQATVSTGLAQFGKEASTLADLLAAADRALYSAKSLGGNRLELARNAA
ncbi:GGDEF domain-containing protein [Paraburkholderia bengalensis]|uniref:diguanylate cyclase n=1 Tax=Paraburkholderia bengalensis TaxID=2747562 RepID=A0ABU8J6C5_9BURK